MKIGEKTIQCRQHRDYPGSNRITPFRLAYIRFDYVSQEADRNLLDRIFSRGKELACRVNPAAANHSVVSRQTDRLIINAAAGILAEYCWRGYINHKAAKAVVAYTPFTDAAVQIDLTVLHNNKLIEVRSSFPRNGITFSICHPVFEFDILGPYSNSVKPGEIRKDFYVRTLYHVPESASFMEFARSDNFMVYLTGGATWQMMKDDMVSKNKNLLPEDTLSKGEETPSSYRVVPFSKALDTPEIVDLIMQDRDAD